MTAGDMMTEAQMLSSLKLAAKSLGFVVFHNTYSIGSDRGFPDLVIVGFGRTFFLELKGPKGRIRPEQGEWIDALLLAGQDARVVWPQNYDAMLDELECAYQATVGR